MIFFLMCGLVFLVLCYFQLSFTYWKRKGVPYLPPSFPFGNFGCVILRKMNMGDKIKEIYDEMKAKGCAFVGLYFFTRKGVLIIDPELVKSVLTKDFQHFSDRGIYYDEVNDPLSAHLFSLSGKKWKHLRGKFTPSFTTGKLKFMFPTLLACGEELVKNLKNVDEVEMKDTMARFTIDVIGSCAFGLECNSIVNPHTKFREVGRRAFTQTIGDLIRVTVIRSFPRVAKIFGLGIFPSSVMKFFKKVVEETVEYRESQSVFRQDFLQLLIELKRNNEEGASLTLNEIAAQAFIFFTAGFETTATTMSFTLFELSLNQEIQHRARMEILKVTRRYNGRLSYEAIMEMRYLDTVVAETLRKYPPAPVYLRKCTEDYAIPGAGVMIERGFSVLIPALALQRDPEYFQNPDEYNPERFSDENKSAVQDYTYIPFGEGPRICIGQRFALLQIKIGLVLILKNFKFTLLPKTSIPLKMVTSGIVLASAEGIWMKLDRMEP